MMPARFSSFAGTIGFPLVAQIAFGGDRANSVPQVAMMNTLFLREHNRTAGLLAAAREAPAYAHDLDGLMLRACSALPPANRPAAAAAEAPARWTMPEPAKSLKPSCLRKPPPQVQ